MGHKLAVGRSAQKKKIAQKKKGTTSVRKTVKRGLAAQKKSRGKDLGLPRETLLFMHDAMVLSRKLEERLIQVYKKGDAFFWIGAPGEEAFGVALGMQVKKGRGPEYDFLHLHYRATPTLIAMGMDVRDSLRLIMNRATDPSTGGRNFSNHYCFPQWNVVPITSPIEVQYPMATGTAIAQRRRKTDAVTIVTGGDAGTAEGDFASSLIWSSRPGFELPMYLTVQNNRWGISTPYQDQHGEERISDRGKAFGIRCGSYNGNDPIEAYKAISADLDYIRKERRPALSEFYVSRLYGHSSASGANRIPDEECCLETFEEKLLRSGYITSKAVSELHKKYEEQIRQAAEEVKAEPAPEAGSLWDHVYVGSENADWRKF